MTATIIRNVRADDAADPRDVFPVIGKGALVVSPAGALRWKILLENGGDKATAFLFVVPTTGQVIVSGVSNNLKSRLKSFQVQPTGQMPLYSAMKQFVGPVHVLAAEFNGSGKDDELRRSLIATYGSAANVTTGSAKRHDASAPVVPVLDTDVYGAAYADAAQDDAADDAGDIPDAALTAAGALALLDSPAEAVTTEEENAANVVAASASKRAKRSKVAKS